MIVYLSETLKVWNFTYNIQYEIHGLELSLQNNGFRIDLALTVREGFLMLSDKKYDLLLLDLTLPNGSRFHIHQKVW